MVIVQIVLAHVVCQLSWREVWWERKFVPGVVTCNRVVVAMMVTRRQSWAPRHLASRANVRIRPSFNQRDNVVIL